MSSCLAYDYIEIACLYRYPIKLTMNSGDTLHGIAMDTKRNSAGVECIELAMAAQKVLIVLDDIATLAVCVENPHFNQVSINSNTPSSD
ncbi:Rho-binding antiterminator [Shewanella maritima]|uniref:Rho-binding antiterminator n=1 Tax=Shewanella maritima TaxID=2520507 RepID=UPI0037365AC9